MEGIAKASIRKLARDLVGMKFDRSHDYVTNSHELETCKLHKFLYDYNLKLKYVSGCFKPYLLEK